jgi:hypothetical protein
MLADEIAELLREFMTTAQAQAVEIIPENQPPPLHSQSAKLGMGCLLCATFHTRESPDAPQTRSELLDRAARALRACIRDAEASEWPLLRLPSDRPDPRRMILARIQQFLQGLVDSSDLYQVALTCRGQLIACAYPLEEMDESRLDLLMRQLDLAAEKKVGSDHGELIHDELYAQSFWYGAGLFCFASKPYAVDFVRHRCKLVARELVHLLTMLDDDPDKPVKTAPIPET